MSRSNLNLLVYSPFELSLEIRIVKVAVFKAKEGGFVMLPNHIDYVSSFDSTIISCVDTDNKEVFIAVNEGIITKCGEEVKVSTYSSIIGDSMEDIKIKIKEKMNESNSEKELNKSLKNVEYIMMNDLMKMKF